MGVVQRPVDRLRGQISERSALRRGLAVVVAPPLRVVPKGAVEGQAAYCAACAAPIEFGAVIRSLESFCSVECSLGGDHPA